MKIAIASDLHLEFGTLWQTKLPGADVLILAGDVAEFRNFRKYEDQILRLRDAYPLTIAIAGNHEFYGMEYNKTIDLLKAWYAERDIIFLENEHFEYEGQQFLGGTMWTDMNKDDYFTIEKVKNAMNDFRQIKMHTDGRGRKFHPKDAIILANKFASFLNMEAEPGAVVISHHLPVTACISTKYLHDPLINGGYAATIMEPLIEKKKPALWIHGHTHEKIDFECYDTRIVANPRGYFGHEAQAYCFELKVVTI